MTDAPHITLEYFSWVREKLQTDSETLPLPQNCHDLEQLLQYLFGRDDRYQALADNKKNLRYAVNYEFAKDIKTKIKNGDTIAIFPPVTGG